MDIHEYIKQDDRII